MQYNTLRRKLTIPEYGRHIQRMVDYCKTIEDRNERNDFAQAIISVMGNLNELVLHYFVGTVIPLLMLYYVHN